MITIPFLFLDNPREKISMRGRWSYVFCVGGGGGGGGGLVIVGSARAAIIDWRGISQPFVTTTV